jgi:hypothetical protein
MPTQPMELQMISMSCRYGCLAHPDPSSIAEIPKKHLAHPKPEFPLGFPRSFA